MVFEQSRKIIVLVLLLYLVVVGCSLQTQGDDDELADIDLNDPELHKAASKIQATFRRRVVPVKEIKSALRFRIVKALCWLSVDCASQTDDIPANVTTSRSNRTPEQQKQDEEDIADIDLGDPDLQKAASKIQATFRKKITIPKKPAGEARKPEVAGGKPE
ncbi:hypothetical protein C0J52_16517 [Blattella germanica]|nr:hypothetical protein C0J52_16517 [Blattella germanica]